MKVNIGPYVKWTGPFQIAQKILFWRDRHEDDSVHNLGIWLATNSKGEDSLLMKLCSWVYSKRSRKIKVHIDNYDVWSMDTTLALIIVPMLEKLKDQKQGIAWIDNADVPEEFRNPENDYCEKKYNWFLDECIWAFSRLTNDDWVDEPFKIEMERDRRADKAFALFGKYYRTLWD